MAKTKLYSLWEDVIGEDGGVMGEFIEDKQYSRRHAKQHLRILADDPEYSDRVRAGLIIMVNADDISDESLEYRPPASEKDAVFAGSTAEVWAWLGENGRQLHLPGLRYALDGYAIFLGNGDVGYRGLFFDNRNYFLKYPFINSRLRGTDGRIIGREARLVVKRVG